MPKRIFYIFLTLLIASCSSAGEQIESTEEVLEEEYSEELETEIAEEAEAAIDEEPKINEDSLADIYLDLEQHYMDHQGLLEDARPHFYSMSRSSFGVYESSEETWYFDEDFNLVYYQMDLGAEGGYGEKALCRVTNDIPWLIFLEIQDADNPTRTIKNFDEDGNVELSAGVKIDYYNNEKTTYFIPDEENYQYDYEDYLRKELAENFTPGEVYKFENSKMVDSEYGGQESAGYRIHIDSVLFQHLYELD